MKTLFFNAPLGLWRNIFCPYENDLYNLLIPLLIQDNKGIRARDGRFSRGETFFAPTLGGNKGLMTNSPKEIKKMSID
jgi:hypothetical protein